MTAITTREELQAYIKEHNIVFHSNGSNTIGLSMKVSPALLLEGIYNDIRHAVNEWRKEQGCSVSERIFCNCEMAKNSFYTNTTSTHLPLPLLDVSGAHRIEFGEGMYSRRCYVLRDDGRYDTFIAENK